MFEEYPICVVKMSNIHKDMFRGHYIENGNVYIGRGSPLFNPYSSKPSAHKNVIMVESREVAIEMFKHDLYNGELKPEAYLALKELKELSSNTSITLVCFCCPEACHGDVIREYLQGDFNV